MFRQRLKSEFDARLRANPRFSLRAFAVCLETDHSTLSQVMKGSRRATVQQVRTFARKLGLPPEEITVYLAAEHVPEAATMHRQERLRHWTAEALALLNGRLHFEILRLCGTPGFQRDCRWMAGIAGVSVDQVNLALTRLLRLGLIDGQWNDQTGLTQLTERAFRRLALARVREKAADDRIQFNIDGGAKNG